MGTLYPRGNKLWLRYKDGRGRWRDASSGFSVDQRREALKQLRKVENAVKAQLARPLSVLGPPTFEIYAKEWIGKRRGTVRSASDDAARLERHVTPFLGHLPLADIRPRHVRDLIIELKAAGKLAPRTIRNVYGALHTLFRDAVIDEIIDANPCVLGKGVMPQIADKDPTWRAGAIFTREELALLLTDPRVLWDRRVMYALKSLGALRHGEAAGMTWERYDLTRKPLGRLLVSHSFSSDLNALGRPKVSVREMPVHPVLADILRRWRADGWERTYGRPPRDTDHIVPTRNKDRHGEQTLHKSPESQEALVRDLGLLGLRHRRGHDLRRTFITLAQVDGAQRHLLKVVTHGPPKEIMDVYTSFPWEPLCVEVAKFRIDLAPGVADGRIGAAEQEAGQG